MTRATNRLSARAVATITKQGYHADGAGLYLQVGATKSWIFRYTRLGRNREMGLGSASVVTLQEARAAAMQQRKVLASGKDPISERKAAQASVSGITWGECADAYIDSHKATWKNEAQAEQWVNSLVAYGPSRAMPVRDIDTDIVVRCLRPIWADKTETATRVRGRIERILDWARVSNYRSGENPARWRGHLDKLLPKPSKVTKKKHFAAMPYADIPAFMIELRKRRALSARALEFTILTVARTGEVTGMSRKEVDGDVWTIPGERMKAGEEHTVPLVKEALDILGSIKNKQPFDLSENAMLYLLQKRMGQPYTVHGFRSAFRDWAAEKTDCPSEVVEKALAHTIRNKTEAAYRRGQLLEKRRNLMQEWADFIYNTKP